MCAARFANLLLETSESVVDLCSMRMTTDALTFLIMLDLQAEVWPTSRCPWITHTSCLGIDFHNRKVNSQEKAPLL